MSYFIRDVQYHSGSSKLRTSFNNFFFANHNHELNTNDLPDIEVTKSCQSYRIRILIKRFWVIF